MSDELPAYEGPYRDRKPTGQLFDVPEVPEPRLTVARKRYEAAVEAFGISQPHPADMGHADAKELLLARRELEAAERERLNR